MDQELRQKTTADLLKMQEESRAELFALRFQIALGNVAKPHRIRLLRKRIARILTIIAERQKAGEAVIQSVRKTDQKARFRATIAQMNKDMSAFKAEQTAKLEAQQQQSRPGALSNSEELSFEGFEELTALEAETPTAVASEVVAHEPEDKKGAAEHDKD